MTLQQFSRADEVRCAAHPNGQHVMVNQGRDDDWYGDLFRCACGRETHRNSDEGQARALSGHPLHTLMAELGI